MDIKVFKSYIEEKANKYSLLDLNDIKDLDSCMKFFIVYKRLIKDKELEIVKKELTEIFNVDIKNGENGKKMTPNQMYIMHQSKFVNSLYSAFILNK